MKPEIIALLKGSYKNRPFDSIFGNKYRITIPFDDYEAKFQKALDALGLFNIDLKEGYAFKKTKTDFGDKDCKVAIGKQLSKAKQLKNLQKYVEIILNYISNYGKHNKNYNHS